MKQRNLYFDFLRGVAIIFVVAIHSFILGEHRNEIRQLLNTAVPLFVAISGFFLSQKKIQTKKDYASFLKHQLAKVYIPVLIWSLPLLLVDIIHGDHIVKNIVLYFVCGYSIYYFVAFIMQCYILLPFITRLESINYRGACAKLLVIN